MTESAGECTFRPLFYAGGMNVLAITHHNGIRLAEVGFLLIAVAGALLIVGALRPVVTRTWAFLSGAALAVGGVLLIVASHWGHFG